MQFDKEASQTRPFGRLCSLRASSVMRAAHSDPLLRKQTLAQDDKQTAPLPARQLPLPLLICYCVAFVDEFGTLISL
jgi:hypothetical protein